LPELVGQICPLQGSLLAGQGIELDDVVHSSSTFLD
jgi:hypothetical protein